MEEVELCPARYPPAPNMAAAATPVATYPIKFLLETLFFDVSVIIHYRHSNCYLYYVVTFKKLSFFIKKYK